MGSSSSQIHAFIPLYTSCPVVDSPGWGRRRRRRRGPAWGRAASVPPAGGTPDSSASAWRPRTESQSRPALWGDKTHNLYTLMPKIATIAAGNRVRKDLFGSFEWHFYLRNHIDSKWSHWVWRTRRFNVKDALTASLRWDTRPRSPPPASHQRHRETTGDDAPSTDPLKAACSKLITSQSFFPISLFDELSQSSAAL